MRKKRNGNLLRRGDRVSTAGFKLKGSYQGRTAKGYNVKVVRGRSTINVISKSRPKKIKK